MLTDNLSKKYRAYVDDQTRRIAEFREEVETQQGTQLGAFPFVDVATSKAMPGNFVPSRIDAESNYPGSLVEERLMSDILIEADRQHLNPDMQFDGIPELVQIDDYNKMVSIQNMLHKSNEPLLDVDADMVIHDTMESLETVDNAYLIVQKKQFEDGVVFQKSNEEVALENIQSDMDAHFAKPGNISPEDEMEALISGAEQDARSLDVTMDRILTLEEAGVPNPIRTMDIEQETVLSSDDPVDQMVAGDKNVTKSDRSLLKLLLNKKEQSKKKDESPDYSNGLDM